MAKPESYENVQTDNKHDGVYAACPYPPETDVRSVPPNKPRPNENKPTKHLFGTFSD